MVEERDKSWNEFNERTLKQFVDDGDKRLNAHTPDRESYDPPKEEWQANVNIPNIKNKQKRMLAGFSFNVPDLQAKIHGEDGMIDIDKGDMSKWIIKGSYLVAHLISKPPLIITSVNVNLPVVVLYVQVIAPTPAVASSWVSISAAKATPP